MTIEEFVRRDDQPRKTCALQMRNEKKMAGIGNLGRKKAAR